MTQAASGRGNGEACYVCVPGEVVGEFLRVDGVGWVVRFQGSGIRGCFDFSEDWQERKAYQYMKRVSITSILVVALKTKVGIEGKGKEE